MPSFALSVFAWKRCLKKLWAVPFFAFAAFNSVAIAFANPPTVPEDIYQWVQSSPRINYFFNKEYIYYEVKRDGFIDVKSLIVPLLKTFDDVQIQDIIAKRRWHRQPYDMLEGHLAGEANHVRIDLRTRTVTVLDHIFLSASFGHLSNEKSKRVIEIDKLGEKSWEGKFYRSIIEYAKDHELELIEHSQKLKGGKLRQVDKERIEREIAEREMAMAKEKKRLEKERKAAERAARRAAREKKQAEGEKSS